MKKIIAATASAVLAAATAIVVAPPAQAASPSDIREDRLFVRLVTEEAPSLKGIGRKTMVKTARQTCKFLRTGFTIIDAIDLMQESGFSENEAIAFISGAVVFYCPEQEDNF